MEDIGTCVGVEVEDTDLDAAHRIPTRISRTSDYPKNIVIRFTSRRKKKEVLMMYKRKKNITTKMLNIAENSAKNLFI